MSHKDKVINGLTFSISQPYAPGHVLTEAEAKALNQTRSENIGNNVRAKVKEFQDANADHATIAAHIAEVDAKYEFTLAGVSASAKLDPVEKEAQRLAKELLRDHLAATGRKLTTVPEGLTKEEWEAKVAAEIELIAAIEDIVKAAKKNVEAKRKQGETLRAALGEALA